MAYDHRLLADLRECVEIIEAAGPSGSVRTSSDWEVAARARLELVKTAKVKYAYLDPAPAGMVLRLYVADTLEQARAFYRDSGAVAGVLRLRLTGWEIRPNFHFGYRERGLCWTTSSLDADTYADYWMDRIDSTGAYPEGEWDRRLRQLIEDGIFDRRDLDQFDRDFTNTHRQAATPRPGLKLERKWRDELPRDEAAVAVRSALRQVLVALGEPLATIEQAPASEAE